MHVPIKCEQFSRLLLQIFYFRRLSRFFKGTPVSLKYSFNRSAAIRDQLYWILKMSAWKATCPEHGHG